MQGSRSCWQRLKEDEKSPVRPPEIMTLCVFALFAGQGARVVTGLLSMIT